MFFGCETTKENWYCISEIDDNTFIIAEPLSSQRNSSFLLEGKDKAILFDISTGENKTKSISEIVDSLTNVSVVVMMSHFHFDYIENIADFNQK